MPFCMNQSHILYIDEYCGSGCGYIHVLMRDERKKEEARSNKQQGKATQHTQDGIVVPTGVDCYVVFLQLVCVCARVRVCACVCT